MVMEHKVLLREDSLRSSLDQARIMSSLLGRVLHRNVLTHPRDQRRDPLGGHSGTGVWAQGASLASERCNSRWHAAKHHALVRWTEVKEPQAVFSRDKKTHCEEP